MVVLVASCVLGGVLVGAVLPEWLARLPEPKHDGGDSTSGADQLQPDATVEVATPEPKIPYARLARARGVRAGFTVMTACCFGIVAWKIGLHPVLPTYLYLTAVALLVGFIDLRVRLLPNAIILPSYLVVLALQAVASLAVGQWSSMLWAVLGGAGFWLLFAVIGLLFPEGFGFGDIKLIGLLALGLGWIGVGYTLLWLVVSFMIGGLFSLALVIGRRASAKSHVPFGPFLVIGYLIALLFADDLVRTYVLG